ncbi:MAG: hypothetical protein AAF564_26235 [Bacteroidota bacterium]
MPVANADFAARMLTNAPVEMKRLAGLDHFIIWTHQEVVVESLLDQVREGSLE